MSRKQKSPSILIARTMHAPTWRLASRARFAVVLMVALACAALAALAALAEPPGRQAAEPPGPAAASAAAAPQTTGGPPIPAADMAPAAATYCGSLLLYNAAYMFDDVVVLAIGVTTLSHRRLQEKEGRRLKLLSGVVMAGLGVNLILAG